eukprot:804980-Pelagomonas_calceolata.AAC.1
MQAANCERVCPARLHAILRPHAMLSLVEEIQGRLPAETVALWAAKCKQAVYEGVWDSATARAYLEIRACLPERCML